MTHTTQLVDRLVEIEGKYYLKGGLDLLHTVNLPPRLESGSVNCYASLFINCRAEKKTFGFDNS